MGAVIGALVVGLMLVVYLISSQPGSSSGGSTTGLQTPGGVSTTVAEAPPPASDPPPRMPIEEFKALYSSANPPVVIDVRSKASYDEGHIKGSISYPEAEVDARAAELPKDKLIVAYCQWPAENESARVAQKLHDQYGYDYNNLKVLLGGWSAWREKNATDATGYPIETSAGGSTGGDTSAPAIGVTVEVPTSVISPTQAP